MSSAASPAADSPSNLGDGPVRGTSWVLLPLCWCLWLLLWLVPSLLIAPHVGSRPLWVRAESAPSALIVAAALFLVVGWPFWPALSGGGRERPERLDFGWIAKCVAELLILLALAVPFAVVAWSVGNRPVSPKPVAGAAGSLALLGLAIRLAYVGIGPESGRWLMFGAMLVAVGPVAAAYGVHEVLEVELTELVELSPVVAALQLCRDGWPEAGWDVFTRLALWPAASAVLVLVALSEMAWRRRRNVATRP
jgi:hypothetical protein